MICGTRRSVLCAAAGEDVRNGKINYVYAALSLLKRKLLQQRILILLFLKVYVVSRDVESRSTISIHHHLSSGGQENQSAVSMKWSVRRSHPLGLRLPPTTFSFQAADAHSSRSESRRRKQPVATSGKDEGQTPIKNSPR